MLEHDDDANVVASINPSTTAQLGAQICTGSGQKHPLCICCRDGVRRGGRSHLVAVRLRHVGHGAVVRGVHQPDAVGLGAATVEHALPRLQVPHAQLRALGAHRQVPIRRIHGLPRRGPSMQICACSLQRRCKASGQRQQRAPSTGPRCPPPRRPARPTRSRPQLRRCRRRLRAAPRRRAASQPRARPPRPRLCTLAAAAPAPPAPRRPGRPARRPWRRPAQPWRRAPRRRGPGARRCGRRGCRPPR